MSKSADLLAFVDSGATSNFVNPTFVARHKLRTKPVKKPRPLRNADGSHNAIGQITSYVDLEVQTGPKKQAHRFYLANLGEDDLILGYPWLAKASPQINWAQRTMKDPVTIRTPGMTKAVVKAIPTRAGMRLKKVTFAQKLAEKATTKTRTWDQIVPVHYHHHQKVFSNQAAQRLPVS